jgi:trimethylamine--corrinoid protein Co-methyltransferase
MGVLSGCTLLHDVGYLESGMTASCESIVIGHEVVEHARRLLQTVEISGETLAVETINRVGPGGTFLQERHTVRHLRDFWYSHLLDRRRYSQWFDDGRQTMFDRLKARVQDILSSHESVPLDESVVQSIHDLIAARDSDVSSRSSRG